MLKTDQSKQLKQKKMTNTDIVKLAYSNVASGNIPGVLALFDPAIEWYECKGMPFVKGDGIFIGPDAIITNVFMNLPVFFDGFNIAVNEIFGTGDRVVMEGYYQGTNKATGNTFKANATHVWTLKDGKLVRFFQAVDTVTIIG
jgi:ketosteroid isomerase-like protein